MSEDLIKRSDAIEAITYSHLDNLTREERIAHINALPSADRPKEVIAQVTFDEEKLREIVKEAVERFKEEYEVADRPQGEWIDKGRNLCGCSNCGMEIYSESEQDRNEFHKWCSRCGARMKGADDEV